jgi:hypothetical protein
MKLEGYAQAGAVVGQLDGRPVERRDCFDQAEAKSVSRRAAAAFQPVEGLKHPYALLDWNSWPAIIHGDGYRP